MKKMVFPVVLMILAGLVFTAVLSCDSGDKGPSITTYTGKDTDGKEYKLVVTDGSKYELFIDGVSTGTGTVKTQGETLTLTQNGEGGYPFTVEVSGKFITKITGQITPDSGGDPIEPGDMVPPFTAVAGVWDWSLSDDADPNGDFKDPASVFAPGGASRFTNAVEDPTETDRYGNKVKRPHAYPAGEAKDDDGKAINATVYNLKGNTKVLKDNRGPNEGARFPMVGWEAVPDTDTLDKLKTAYGYSFWVRLNSATAGHWAFLTAVVTDFKPEEGYEYKHWFGDKPGDSGGSIINNFTSNLKVGTWYKITVIMDKNGFNMDEDAWLYNWPPKNDPKKAFNQAAAEKIQWQIPLQHQDSAGVSARKDDPFDIIRGSYDFDLDFYGLELLMK